MKTILIISMVLLTLMSLPLGTKAYTLTGEISGGIQFGGITYIYAVSLDTSGTAPVFFLGFALLGNGNYAIYSVIEGDYILFAYQDRDNTITPTIDDYFGVYGDTLPTVVAVTGNMSDLDIQIAPLPATIISGSIDNLSSCSGLTFLQAASDPEFQNVLHYSFLLDTTGSGDYTLFVEPGVYYVRAYLDADFNLIYTPNDPMGYYGYPGAPLAVDVSTSAAENINFSLNPPLEVEKSNQARNLPSDCMLYPPFPNPFNPSTTISFSLTIASEVSLAVYDISGREIASLVNGHLSPGQHQVIWNAEGLPNGVYFVRLTVDSGQSLVKKLVLMK